MSKQRVQNSKASLALADSYTKLGCSKHALLDETILLLNKFMESKSCWWPDYKQKIEDASAQHDLVLSIAFRYNVHGIADTGKLVAKKILRIEVENENTYLLL